MMKNSQNTGASIFNTSSSSAITLCIPFFALPSVSYFTILPSTVASLSRYFSRFIALLSPLFLFFCCFSSSASLPLSSPLLTSLCPFLLRVPLCACSALLFTAAYFLRLPSPHRYQPLAAPCSSNTIQLLITALITS